MCRECTTGRDEKYPRHPESPREVSGNVWDRPDCNNRSYSVGLCFLSKYSMFRNKKCPAEIRSMVFGTMRLKLLLLKRAEDTENGKTPRAVPLSRARHHSSFRFSLPFMVPVSNLRSSESYPISHNFVDSGRNRSGFVLNYRKTFELAGKRTVFFCLKYWDTSSHLIIFQERTVNLRTGDWYRFRRAPKMCPKCFEILWNYSGWKELFNGTNYTKFGQISKEEF